MNVSVNVKTSSFPVSSRLVGPCLVKYLATTDCQLTEIAPDNKEKVVDNVFENIFRKDPEIQRDLLGKR